jgi:hypothetical protein
MNICKFVFFYIEHHRRYALQNDPAAAYNTYIHSTEEL